MGVLKSDLIHKHELKTELQSNLQALWSAKSDMVMHNSHRAVICALQCCAAWSIIFFGTSTVKNGEQYTPPPPTTTPQTFSLAVRFYSFNS